MRRSPEATIEYLVRYRDPNTGHFRHTVILAKDDDDASELAQRRTWTPSWKGCTVVWVRRIWTRPPIVAWSEVLP